MGAVCDADQMQVDRGLLPSDRHVFLRLVGRHNAITGLCWPGHGKLAEDTGLSVRTIGEACQALWRAGFIDWTERWIEGSVEQDTNEYKIHFMEHPDSTQEKRRLILTPVEPRTGNRPRQERPPIQAIAIPRHRKLKKKKDTEVGGVVQPLHYPPAESAIPPCGSSTTPVQILHDPPAPDAEKPGSKPGVNQGGKQGGTSVVVVRAAPTEKEGEGHSLDSSFQCGKHDGMDLSGGPVKPGDGKTDGMDMGDDPHHHHPAQVKPDPGNGDGALEGEYLSPVATDGVVRKPASREGTAAAPAASAQPTDPHDAPFEQVLGDLGEARDFAKFFYALLGEPGEHRHLVDAWERPARRLLGYLSLADLKGIATFARNHTRFWGPALLQPGRDPLTFLEDRIDSDGPQSLLVQYRGRQNFNNTKKKEAGYGQKTINNTGRSRAELRSDAITAAGDDALKALQQRFSQTSEA
jgi:hypothetical protein